MTAQPLSGRRVLAGKRVLVTRAAHQAGKLSEGLRALGAEPVEVPVLEIQPPSSIEPLDRALRSLDSYDWLILTSVNTVRALQERSAVLGLSLRSKTGLKVAAVGEATATAARNAGFAVSLVPEIYVAEAWLRVWKVKQQGRRYCWRGLRSRATSFPMRCGPQAPPSTWWTPTATQCRRPRRASCARRWQRESTQRRSPARRA